MKNKRKQAEAPQSVQEFRRVVRQECGFYRGVNSTADLMIDDLIAWLVDDLVSGRIKSSEEAARVVGVWACARLVKQTKAS